MIFIAVHWILCIFSFYCIRTNDDGSHGSFPSYIETSLG